VLAVIEPFVAHERPLIRSAACRALLQLTGDQRWGEQLQNDPYYNPNLTLADSNFSLAWPARLKRWPLAT
jgi:hypothetical protein